MSNHTGFGKHKIRETHRDGFTVNQHKQLTNICAYGTTTSALKVRN